MWHSNDKLETYGRNNMAFKCRLVGFKNKNRAFKCQFLDIAKVWLSLIRGYNAENTQDWKIYNKIQFEAISNAQDRTRLTNNFWHIPILVHRELMGIHRNAREGIGAHVSAQEWCIISNKSHRKRPINTRMSTHLPSTVVVAVVLFFVLFLRRLFE